MFVLPKIEKLITSLRAMASTQALLNAFLGPAGWAMLSGGVAAAGIAGYAISNAMNQPASNTNVNVNINSQQDIYM